MEYIIVLAVALAVAYVASRRIKSSDDAKQAEAAAPYKVEAPTIEEKVEEPTSTLVEAALAVVEIPAKKLRKPRAIKVEQVPVKTRAPVTRKAAAVAKAPVKAVAKAPVKAVAKAPAKKPAAIKAKSKKA